MGLSLADPAKAFAWTNSPKSMRLTIDNCRAGSAAIVCDGTDAPGIWVPEIKFPDQDSIAFPKGLKMLGTYARNFPPSTLELLDGKKLRYTVHGQMTDYEAAIFVLEAQCFRPE